jgi:pimeloyl-ACP methyl ester carboxylesterase
MPDGTLVLDNATVDYDLRGEGPPLLLIPGGSGDAGLFGPLIARLTDQYTVIAMYSRLASHHGPDPASLGDQHPAVHAEDAFRLLDRLTDEPAIVFGFSSGSITAIELTMRHPERVRFAVVHETPMTHLLPDADRQRAMFESVRATASGQGLDEAAAIMIEGVTAVHADEVPVPLRHFGNWLEKYAETEPEPPAPELAQVFARVGRLQPAFLEHMLVPFSTHAPDPEALRAVAAKIVPIAGIDSRGQLPYRAAAALAARVDLPLTEFPGGHLAPVQRPRQFAAALIEFLQESPEAR